MKPWPNNLPPDLRKRLDDVMRYRSFGAPEIYAEVKEWLEGHGVEPPDTLPEASIRDFMGPD